MVFWRWVSERQKARLTGGARTSLRVHLLRSNTTCCPADRRRPGRCSRRRGCCWWRAWSGVECSLPRPYTQRLSVTKQTTAGEVRPAAGLLLVAGMVSSTSAQLVSYPLGLVRTRLQARCVMYLLLNPLFQAVLCSLANMADSMPSQFPGSVSSLKCAPSAVPPRSLCGAADGPVLAVMRHASRGAFSSTTCGCHA